MPNPMRKPHLRLVDGRWECNCRYGKAWAATPLAAYNAIMRGARLM